MAGRKYPRSTASYQRDLATLPEDQGPRCLICGRQALFRVFVEVGWFRGDDEGPFPACKDHRSDHAQALLDADEAKRKAAAGAKELR